MADLSDFDRGLLIGLLIGEGSFGGDGRQPQVVLRMHTRHEALFQWLQVRFPRCRLYGAYHHSGRSYYQWMARGPGLILDLLPILERELRDDLDAHSAGRFRTMCERYAGAIARGRHVAAEPDGEDPSRSADGARSGPDGARSGPDGASSGPDAPIRSDD